jgi:hypothetical protein
MSHQLSDLTGRAQCFGTVLARGTFPPILRMQTRVIESSDGPPECPVQWSWGMAPLPWCKVLDDARMRPFLVRRVIYSGFQLSLLQSYCLSRASIVHALFRVPPA